MGDLSYITPSLLIPCRLVIHLAIETIQALKSAFGTPSIGSAWPVPRIEAEFQFDEDLTDAYLE